MSTTTYPATVRELRPEDYLTEKTRADLDRLGIVYPVTVRELGAAADALGINVSDMLEPATRPISTTPPEWATSTETGVSLTAGGDPICSHYGELFDVADVSVSIVRDDIWTNGQIITGETKVVLNAADQLEVDADALAAIGQSMIAAAERVRELL